MDMALFKSQRTQRTFMDETVYDRLIPRDHLLVKLNQAMDWSFIEEACKPFYQNRGRLGESPVLLFKMLFLAYLYKISERRIEEDCTFNVLFKYFLGLEVDEKAPDHSTLSKFRDRLGKVGFEAIFNRLVELARQQGIVSDELRIVDSTLQIANVDVLRANLKLPRDPDDDDKTALPGSSDPDARFGHKTKEKTFYGYKQHIGVDLDHDFITNVATSPGNISDDDYLMAMATGPPPQALTADKLYDKPHHHDRLKNQGTKSFIIRKKGSPIPRSRKYPWAAQQRKRIERVFAVIKNHHSGKRARYRGLARVSVQNIISAFVYDVKELVKHLATSPGGLCPKAV